MLDYQLTLLQFFYKNELDFYGKPVDWSGYDFLTMQELDRIRSEVGSECRVIRGGHGYLKETAVDAVFPKAAFPKVVMAMYRSGFSKGLYEGGSIHLDNRMGPSGLARCWMAFKPSSREEIANRGLVGLCGHHDDGWDYYDWGHVRSFELLQYLIEINSH